MTGFRDDTDRTSITRRRLLAASAATTAALAGCASSDDSNQEPGPEGSDSGFVQDPPDRVYLPSHQDGMAMLPMQRAGDFRVMPHWTYPHTFWLTRDTETTREDPGAQSLHFMFAVWDGQTGQLLPVNVAGPMRVFRDGTQVGRPGRPWPMISQGMGFHFGDNRQFGTAGYDGDQPQPGTYEIEMQLRPANARKTGAFADRFTEPKQIQCSFEFQQSMLDTIDERTRTYDRDRWGEATAAESMRESMMGGMEMETPGIGLPPAAEYPGELLGQSADGSLPTSHDAAFVVSYLEESRLSDGDSGYLAVSPRTPYNRVPLPEMSLSVEGAVEGELTQTLDDELGHHYGLSATLGSDASFELVVDAPPQVARHRGYQTAFLDMPPVSIQR